MLPWAQVHREPANLLPFSEVGEASDLLGAFDMHRAKIERQNIDKEPASITRRLAPYRNQLEIDLLALAVRNRVTSGKWMFFPAAEDLPRFWRLIATATAEGKLGPTSKVGTYDPAEKCTVICVYTYDFSDTEDVIRVLHELSDLGLLVRNGFQVYCTFTEAGMTSMSRTLADICLQTNAMHTRTSTSNRRIRTACVQACIRARICCMTR